MLIADRYRLSEAPLSTGNFGSVFLAEDEKMARSVAVKVLHPQHATNLTARERFRREMAAACRVSHANVVTVYDHGEDPRLGLFYSMELVRGTSLKERLEGEPLPWEMVARIGIQLASALAAIHAAGIVHRDLKPQNIMLVERPGLDELVKVLDFGIASIKSTDEEKQEQQDQELTGARMVLGTPPYMSPEQTYMRADRERLEVEVDARSDLYALGIILYEMAAGRRPFNGDAHEIVIAHRHVPPMPLERMVGVVVPRAFADLVNQCLSKEPRERPQSAVELVAALKACVGLPVRRWMSEPDPHELGTESAMVALPVGVRASRSVPDGVGGGGGVGEPKAARIRRATWMIAVVALAVGGGAFFVQRMAAAPGEKRAEARPVELTSNAGPGVAAREGPEGAVGPEGVAGLGPGLVGEAPLESGAAAGVVAGKVPVPNVEAAVPSVGVMVASEPAGATVLIDGVPRGVTPVTIPVDAPQAGRIEVLLRKERHQDTKVMLAIGPELGGKVLVVSETLAKLHKPVALAPGVAKPDGPSPALTKNVPSGPSADPFKDL